MDALAPHWLHFDWVTNPSIWIGLFTLIVLEIVLGVDNLVFIAILADKLPPEQRDKARIIGLSLALVMRLGLLSVMSWLVTLTEPLFHLGHFGFSGRDLILLIGGLFLLFKATSELHERLEGIEHKRTRVKRPQSNGIVEDRRTWLETMEENMNGRTPAKAFIDGLPKATTLPTSKPHKAA